MAKRRPDQSPQPNQPVPISEVLDELVDIPKHEIKIDSEAEAARKLQVAERLAETLQQTRKELIEQAEAGEEVDQQTMNAVGEELQQTIAWREELRQQQEP
jgi:hypothetical protein